MDNTYRDRWIECTPEDIQIRGYYFPWGTKRIPYGSIRSLRRVALSTFRGRLRIWGTADPRYWASLDPQRRKKSVGFVVDLERHVRPLVTPDDADTFEVVVRRQAGLGPDTGEAEEGPFV